VNPRDDLAGGTVPALPFMNDQNIRRRRFQEAHYFEENEQLSKYVTERTSTSTRDAGAMGRDQQAGRRIDDTLFFDTREVSERVTVYGSAWLFASCFCGVDLS
jgi:hypothetical protein